MWRLSLFLARDGSGRFALCPLLPALPTNCDEDHSNWGDLLTPLEFAYNNSCQASTGFFPFFLNSGRQPRTPAALHYLCIHARPQHYTTAALHNRARPQHYTNVSRLKPFEVDDDYHGIEIFLPPPVTSADDSFTAECFLETRHIGTRQQYLVRWRNSPPEHDSWHDGPELKRTLTKPVFDALVRAMPRT